MIFWLQRMFDRLFGVTPSPNLPKLTPNHEFEEHDNVLRTLKRRHGIRQ